MSFSSDRVVPHGYGETSSTPKFNLGHVSWSDDGKAFRYVQFADGVATIVGHVMCYEAAQTNGYVVTNDRSSDDNSTLAAGVCMAVIDLNVTTPQYGWIQVSGYCANISTDGSVNAAESLVPHASVDGQADTMAAGAEDHVFAVALSTDTGNLTDGILRGML
tara:strand:- start:3593 stop:4078 length:486 start_codon:yes stop_codon:yes gene_type:complete